MPPNRDGGADFLTVTVGTGRSPTAGQGVDAEGEVREVLIQEGLAVVYDGGTKGKECCE